MEKRPVEVVLKQKRIEEVINPRLVQSTPDITIREAVEIMQSNRSSYIVIAKNKKVKGIITEVDITRKVLGKDVDWNKPVSDFMATDPICLKPTDLVKRAIDIMGEQRWYHIPLVDDKGDLVNVLSVRSLIRFLAEFYPQEVYNLPPVPDQVIKTQEGG